MATAESIAADALRPFQRSCDVSGVIGNIDKTPLVLLNTDAPVQALSALAVARLELVEQWVMMLATSDSELVIEPKQIAAMLLPLVEDARRVADALDDVLAAQVRAQRAAEAASH
jgi:hypothetical protein